MILDLSIKKPSGISQSHVWDSVTFSPLKTFRLTEGRFAVDVSEKLFLKELQFWWTGSAWLRSF